MLYFSYGSNMSSARLLARVPSARIYSTAILVAHDLRFHKKSKDGSGKCDAFHTGNPRDQINGVVFEIDVTGKRVLDRLEGLGIGYDEKEVALMAGDGQAFRALTYYDTIIDETLKPYHWYKHHVLAGALENGLPEVYVNSIRAVETIADPNQQRHELEMGIYAGNKGDGGI